MFVYIWNQHRQRLRNCRIITLMLDKKIQYDSTGALSIYTPSIYSPFLQRSWRSLKFNERQDRGCVGDYLIVSHTAIFSSATKNSGLVTTLATRFLDDLDLNSKRVKLKQTFHLMLLCFHHKKCAKSHQQSQFTSKFIATSVRDIFKQSNLMNHTILQGFWKVAEKKSNFVAFSETFVEIFRG